VGEFFIQLWQNIIGRASGPMWPRLLLQPAVATFFAIRAGLRDAKEGETPYGWAVLTQGAHRDPSIAPRVERVRQGVHCRGRGWPMSAPRWRGLGRQRR
jgi:hypothetical protein